MKFKPGDKVRCIDDHGASDLRKDVIYTVKYTEYNMLSLEELGQGYAWFTHRFELVEESFEDELTKFVWSKRPKAGTYTVSVSYDAPTVSVKHEPK